MLGDESGNGFRSARPVPPDPQACRVNVEVIGEPIRSRQHQAACRIAAVAAVDLDPVGASRSLVRTALDPDRSDGVEGLWVAGHVFAESNSPGSDFARIHSGGDARNEGEPQQDREYRQVPCDLRHRAGFMAADSAGRAC